MFEQREKKLVKEHIRNFCIIAHVNHGKSTLSNLFLKKLSLDYNQQNDFEALCRFSLEETKGITIKLHAIQLRFICQEDEKISYVFNLIDTPGHVDFESEVTLSLAVCEGAILLVDASKGIQSQTFFYHQIAKKLGLKIIPVISKIDLPDVQILEVKKQLISLIGCLEEDILLLSAKTSSGFDLLLKKIISEFKFPD